MTVDGVAADVVPRRGRAVRAGGRAVLGLVVLAVAAATIIASLALPTAHPVTDPVAVNVTPVPTAAVSVCPGPLLASATQGSATAVGSFGGIRLVDGSWGAKVAPAQLAAPDDAAGTSNGAPPVLTAPAARGAAAAPVVAAAQSQAATGSEMRGLAAAACTAPVNDAWFVGGATSLGQSTLLLLGNPSGVAAIVALQIYSETGEVQAAGASGIVVQPRSQRVVSLAGLAPKLQSPVVHLTSTGSAVTAALEQSAVSGITPLGVDLIGATAAPASHQVIPGAVFSATPATVAAGENAQAGAGALRVYAPGTGTVSVTVGITADRGTRGTAASAARKASALGTAITANVTAGQVQEIPISHVPAGSFTVTVDAARPVVVALRTTTQAANGSDFGWFVAARPLTSDGTAVAVVPGAAALVHFVNPGSKAITVHVGGSVVHVPAGSAIAAAERPGAYPLSGASGLYASVSVAGPGALAGYVVAPPGAGKTAVAVFTH